jgi:hypothetical protein
LSSCICRNCAVLKSNHAFIGRGGRSAGRLVEVEVLPACRDVVEATGGGGARGGGEGGTAGATSSSSSEKERIVSPRFGFGGGWAETEFWMGSGEDGKERRKRGVRTIQGRIWMRRGMCTPPFTSSSSSSEKTTLLLSFSRASAPVVLVELVLHAQRHVVVLKTGDGWRRMKGERGRELGGERKRQGCNPAHASFNGCKSSKTTSSMNGRDGRRQTERRPSRKRL